MTFDGRLLSSVSVLAAIIEAGSFARAADALGLTPSGISRAVSRLEARIGVRLLDRTTRSVTLTDEGRRLYEEIAPLMNGISDAVTLATDSSTAVRGRLRVNVDAFFSRLIFSPHIRSFLEEFPEISLELITKEQLGDLVAEGFDIAVRFGEPPSSSLVARKLLETRLVTVASPTYLEQYGYPKKPEDLAKHICIQVKNPNVAQALDWRFRRGKKTIAFKTDSRLMVTEVGTMLEACLSGYGIAQVKAMGVQELLGQGKLIDLFPDWPDDTFALYALYPSRHLPPAKVRAFIDFVVRVTSGA